MALEIAKQPPDRAYLGTRIEWQTELAEYPAADWSLAWVLDGPGPNLTVAGVESGTATYTFTLDEAGELAVGFWNWQLIAQEDASERREVIRSGVLEALPSFLNAQGPDDASTHNSRMLEMIDLALEGKIPRDSESYSINGRSVTRIPIETLVRLRDRYEAAVARELRARSKGVDPRRRRRIRAVFTG